MKNALPGAIDAETGHGLPVRRRQAGPRRLQPHGLRQPDVLTIAPAATLFAYMVGITLGLPAGYFGGWIDTVLSFLANLVLAFPVILLFYLLVTPGITRDGDPRRHGGGAVLPVPDHLLRRRCSGPASANRPEVLWYYLGLTLAIGGFGSMPAYGLWDADPLAHP